MNMIAKVDQQGRRKAMYRSAREAAKDNGISSQAVLNRCHNLVNHPYEMVPGYTFQFFKINE